MLKIFIKFKFTNFFKRNTYAKTHTCLYKNCQISIQEKFKNKEKPIKMFNNKIVTNIAVRIERTSYANQIKFS